MYRYLFSAYCFCYIFFFIHVIVLLLSMKLADATKKLEIFQRDSHYFESTDEN